MAKGKKDKLTKIIERKAEERLEEVKRIVRVHLDSEISKDKRHCSLVRNCKSFFINLNEGKYIDYDVVMREPLLDLSLEKRNVSVFDLIAINSKSEMISLVECKTGSSARNMLSDFVDKIISFRKYREHLEGVLGFDFKDAEFILCIESANNHDVLQSISSHIEKKRKNQSTLFDGLTMDEMERIVVWSVLESENKIVKTYSKHLDPRLDSIMSNPPQFDSMSDLDLEYYSHPWRYIERIIYEKIYVEKRRFGATNPKEFTPDEVIKKLIEEFKDLAVDNNKLQFVAEQKASYVIKHGLKYDIFEKLSNDRYRIVCRGERISTVREYLERKYIKNYVDIEAKKKALEEAEKEIKRKFKVLPDFFDVQEDVP